MEKIKRVIELRIEHLKNSLNDGHEERADQRLEEIEFLERVLEELNGTATGDILMDLTQGEPHDWLIQHPIGE
jgi:hypothetical protein